MRSRQNLRRAPSQTIGRADDSNCRCSRHVPGSRENTSRSHTSRPGSRCIAPPWRCTPHDMTADNVRSRSRRACSRGTSDSAAHSSCRRTRPGNSDANCDQSRMSLWQAGSHSETHDRSYSRRTARGRRSGSDRTTGRSSERILGAARSYPVRTGRRQFATAAMQTMRERRRAEVRSEAWK